MSIIKQLSKKMVILGIIFFIIMSISGIYAGAVQIANSYFVTGAVNIEIHNYTLNSQNEEVKYNDADSNSMPGDIISFIPKIQNLGEKSYVRIKVTYINNNVDFKQYITGISNKWKKCGDYYYYNEALNSNETIKIFDTIEIPENINEITDSKNIKLEIVAEAVQEKNFTPDYESDDPWKGITPQKNTNTSYVIDTDNDPNMIIKYEKNAAEDIFADNLFEEIKTVMPGDIYSSIIEIKNTNKKIAKYYLTLNITEKEIKKVEFLNELNLVITNKEGQVIYNNKIKNNERILLGEYKLNEYDTLEFKILVPHELSNKYAYLNPKLNWTFSVDYDGNETNPKTGDKISVAITIFLISSLGLIIVMLLYFRENKNVNSID